MNVASLEGAHDAQREALRLHAERGRLGRRADRHHRAVPRHHLLPGRDERRRRVNFYSRVQMYLFKAKQAAQRRVRARAHGERRHARAGPGLPRVEPEVPEPVLQGGARLLRATTRTSSPPSRRTSRRRAASAGARASRRSRRAARRPSQTTPHVTVNLFQTAVEQAPVVAARVKEDLTMFRELRAEKKRSKNVVQTMDAAAEE